FTVPARTAAIASNGSPTRNTCSPACSGPTCSTSMCRSCSDDLSMPCDRQAWENAQVEQKVSASPSSASTLGLRRGNAVSLTRRPSARSDGAGEARRGAGGVRGWQVAVEAHGDITQQQPSLRGRGDAIGPDPHQAIVPKRDQHLQRLGKVVVEIDRVAPFQGTDRDL